MRNIPTTPCDGERQPDFASADDPPAVIALLERCIRSQGDLIATLIREKDDARRQIEERDAQLQRAQSRYHAAIEEGMETEKRLGSVIEVNRQNASKQIADLQATIAEQARALAFAKPLVEAWVLNGPSMPISELEEFKKHLEHFRALSRPTPATSGETPEILTVSDEEWEHFIGVMNSPAEPTPALRKLLTEPSPWTASQPPADLVEALWQDLLDKDDRTSPEEYPDMALITKDEFVAALAAGQAENPRLDGKWREHIRAQRADATRRERERTLAAINAVRDSDVIRGRSYSACWMNACTEIECALSPDTTDDRTQGGENDPLPRPEGEHG